MARIQLLDDLLNLFYPRLCAGCGENLVDGEDHICTRCLWGLHRTGFHNERDNAVEKLFWGKVDIRYGASLAYYHKESRLQQMIFKLKYHGEKEVGLVLGAELGLDLRQSPFAEIDAVIPVPLHPRRLKQRGYNQSEWIARGVSQTMRKPVDNKSLRRAVATQTQTKKNRFERFQNVSNIFQVTSPGDIEGRHVLLVDDVITTGSTLEACAAALKEVPGTTVSVASLGVADN